jgi:hypothetical protein
MDRKMGNPTLKYHKGKESIEYENSITYTNEFGAYLYRQLYNGEWAITPIQKGVEIKLLFPIPKKKRGEPKETK